MSPRALAPALAALALACSGAKDSAQEGDSGGGAGGADGAADGGGEAALLVDHWIGTSQYSDAEGQPRGAPEEVWLRRTLDPAASTLLEELRTRSGDAVSQARVEGAVDAAAGTWAFTMDAPEGALSGEGVFTAGEPWAWTAWRSTSVFVDGDSAGVQVVSTDQRTAEGLEAIKVITAADGSPYGSVAETLLTVTAAEWEAAVAAL